MDNYEKFGKKYSESHEKPDKKYVMPATALKMLKPLKNKIVIDVGCGEGYFTKILAKKAKKVYGIDKAKNQIKNANKNKLKNIEYLQADMTKFNYPKSDRIFAPFVLNYLKNEAELTSFFKKLYDSLNKKGKIAGMIDAPRKKVHNMKQMGVIKRIEKLEQGQKIDVELYNNNKKIVTLHSIYHPPKLISSYLRKAGFKKVKWHKPIIPKEAIKKKGKNFWKGYAETSDLAYFSAEK